MMKYSKRSTPVTGETVMGRINKQVTNGGLISQ